MIFPEVNVIYGDQGFEDFRGQLFTLFKQEDHRLDFIHDKVSISRKNVLRGLHGDSKSWKLVTCLAGEIYLVVVDNRPDSVNYKKWDSIVLTESNKVQVLIPPMFANGHYILSDKGVFFYKWAYPGAYPDVKDQFTLKWNDPTINIYWPSNNPILSLRDK